MAKLGARDRAHLVALAYRHHLVVPPGSYHPAGPSMHEAGAVEVRTRIGAGAARTSVGLSPRTGRSAGPDGFAVRLVGPPASCAASHPASRRAGVVESRGSRGRP